MAEQRRGLGRKSGSRWHAQARKLTGEKGDGSMKPQSLTSSLMAAGIAGVAFIVMLPLAAPANAMQAQSSSSDPFLARYSSKPAIYAIVDSVTFEPSREAPERIRIAGTFMVPRPVSAGLHLPPQQGFLYFSMDHGREPAITREWSALAAAAGTNTVVGFGEYWDARSGTNTALTVVVHSADADVATPEPYPVSHYAGVLNAFDRPQDAHPRFGKPSAELIAELRDAHRP
jgi:hypothetical protein